MYRHRSFGSGAILFPRNEPKCVKLLENRELSHILLSLLKGEQVYVFCSDDKAARNGAISFNNVRCISALSAFLRLKKEISWTFDAAEPYINSYVQFCGEHNQQTSRMKIFKTSCRMNMTFHWQTYKNWTISLSCRLFLCRDLCYTY